MENPPLITEPSLSDDDLITLHEVMGNKEIAALGGGFGAELRDVPARLRAGAVAMTVAYLVQVEDFELEDVQRLLEGIAELRAIAAYTGQLGLGADTPSA